MRVGSPIDTSTLHMPSSRPPLTMTCQSSISPCSACSHEHREPRRPSKEQEYIGRWIIEEMDLWDRDALDLVAPAFIEFRSDKTGQFGFIAVEAGWIVEEPASTTGPDWNSRGTATTSAILPVVEGGLLCSRTAP